LFVEIEELQSQASYMKLNFSNAGACLYNLQAHEDSLVSISSAPSYIITLGLDERIRVWERFQGHLLNTINLHQAHSNSIVMLTPSLLITAKPGLFFGIEYVFS
jgi:WD40 repeat protein